MKIKDIIITINLRPTDIISIVLDAPPPIQGNSGSHPDPIAHIDTSKGYGIEWVRASFPGVPFAVFNAETGIRKDYEK